MNSLIISYFEEIETKILQSAVVKGYTILRKNTSEIDGKIRIRIELINNDLVDLFEYVTIDDGILSTSKYHFHWQDNNNQLKIRLDNAPHHKELENFPHHIHYFDKVDANISIPNIIDFIKLIEKEFNNN